MNGRVGAWKDGLSDLMSAAVIGLASRISTVLQICGGKMVWMMMV